MADIFLSHSGADNDLADQIKSWLERDRKNWSVFLDKHPRDGILAGQGWQDRLRSELQSCRLVLAIITPDWLASRWCFTEAVIATFRGKDFVGVLPKELPDAALEAAPPIVHDRQRQSLDLVLRDDPEHIGPGEVAALLVEQATQGIEQGVLVVQATLLFVLFIRANSIRF